jgi:DNA-binding MarR family transcriptional regulator
MNNGELNCLLGRLSRLHFRRSYTEFSRLGITRGQPRILRYLESHEGCIQRELSENCHLEPATITNTLEKMEQKGLIERRYEPGSHRNVQVFLTDKGREGLQLVGQVNKLLEEECFAGFAPDEVGLAADFLERICQNMIKADEAGQEN